MTTTIYIAENDHQGNRCGKVKAISFFHGVTGEETQFSTFPNLDGVDITHSCIKEIRISGKLYTRFSSKDWVGNNQWNAYQVTVLTALQMMYDLYRNDDFGFETDDNNAEYFLERNSLMASHMGWATETTEPASEVEPNQLTLF